MKRVASISYFEREGNDNLAEVLRVLKRTLKRRPILQGYKIVFFTSIGKGPALAYNLLEEFEPKIIAVTFPPSFRVKVGNEITTPTIAPKIRKFFDSVGIKVITGRLPFDKIEGAEAHNQQMSLVKDVLSIFGGSFPQCIQAVLQACDSGELKVGENVISVTGDCAAIVAASTTEKCFSSAHGLVVSEILCKPKNLTIARTTAPLPVAQEARLFKDIPDRPALTSKTIEGKVEKKETEHKG